MDLIGDVHGHADELEALLKKLGYAEKDGYYQHPTRKVFFVGDFIDRGPQIKRVLEIVKAMIDHGAAHTVMGNHEFNAICYWTKDKNGNYLREHSAKNTHQHQKTIDAFDDRGELMMYVGWFKTLPIYFDSPEFRVVHAQWDQVLVDELKKREINNFTDENFLIAAGTKGTDDYKLIDRLLKGGEVKVPEVSFTDKDGHVRNEYRVKWWVAGNSVRCGDALFEFPVAMSDQLMKEELMGYPSTDVPVFFGHYWLKDAVPLLRGENVCCLDFSVAKGGILVAYRWGGERVLSGEKFAVPYS